MQLSLFLPTARMLLTVTQASPAACRQVVALVSLMKSFTGRCNVQGVAFCFTMLLFLVNRYTSFRYILFTEINGRGDPLR